MQVTMESLRKWFYRPKRDDKSLLAQFFFADEDLNLITHELDSFDGRKDPERCTFLVNMLRQSQDRVLTITNNIMDALIPSERANRDFRVKFPEDVLQENLAGQLWFGAECLAAGSSIMNREFESAAMRPLAKALTKSLENVRNLLREACFRSNMPNGPLRIQNHEFISESLKIFDRLFAEFELRYVSAMVPVKTTQEYELQELIGVLFSETLQRALKMGLLSQEHVDDYDPALMFTIPRLAIVSGLLIYPNGPLCIDQPEENMSEMFRPFKTLLHKIRELLWTLNKRELYMLEKLLCDQISDVKSVSEMSGDLDDFVNQFYNDYPLCKDYVTNLYHRENGKIQEGNKIGNGGFELYPDYETISDSSLPAEIPPTLESLTPIQITDPVPPLDTIITNVIAVTSVLSINETEHSNSNPIEIPSTSGYLLANTVEHDNIVASLSNPDQQSPPRGESLPDRDCLETMTAATATLSTYLSNCDEFNNKSEEICKSSEEEIKEDCLYCGPDNMDSGISTENTSLDRSPSLDNKDDFVAGTSSKRSPRRGGTPRHRKRLQKVGIVVVNTLSIPEGGGRSGGSGCSSETETFDSDCADDEEIALAMQAAEIASRNEVRSKFRSTEDLLHRLFVCIAGVADQLQTNYASDLRNILHAVFLINASASEEPPPPPEPEPTDSMEYRPSESDIIPNDEFAIDPNILAQEALFDTNVYLQVDDITPQRHHNDDGEEEEGEEEETRVENRTEDESNPPVWIPDIQAPKCMSCEANFTVVKRRHHCRNCGKVFCARCSANSVPLPKYGHHKPVRVCNKCFMFQLTPFTL